MKALWSNSAAVEEISFRTFKVVEEYIATVEERGIRKEVRSKGQIPRAGKDFAW
jgi:hypothetical protein